MGKWTRLTAPLVVLATAGNCQKVRLWRRGVFLSIQCR
ncbi:Hypothetical protein RAK1035_1104 [Roseovarius sp. AK1035]|nr:Hypothetical protein RAK1035_1104 [Roseovarius sp. AK1035]